MVDVLAQNGVALEEAQVAQAAAEGRAKALQLEVEAMAEAEAGIVSREQALEHGMTAQKARLQEQVEAREAAEEAAAALRVELAQQRISFEQELRTVRTELVQARTEVATLKSPSPSSNAAADNVRSHATCVVVSPKLTHRLSMKQDDKAWQSKCSQAELQVEQLKVMVRTTHSRARVWTRLSHCCGLNSLRQVKSALPQLKQRPRAGVQPLHRQARLAMRC